MNYKLNITENQAEVIKSLAGKVHAIKGFADNRESRLKHLAKNRKEIEKRRKEKLLDLSSSNS